ncbi:MAG TPA: hypothetical protein VF220_01965 [Nitrososphaeraceae archaeon]
MEKTFSSIEPFKPNTIVGQKFCVKCASPATKTVRYNIEGATLLERYCDTCASPFK